MARHVLPLPALNFTTTPASMVKTGAEAAATITAPVTTYGLFASVHVVDVEMVPLTLVSAEATEATSVRRMLVSPKRRRFIDHLRTPSVRIGRGSSRSGLRLDQTQKPS